MPDEQLESFLREFQPRRPRALPETRARAPLLHPRLAAAAVILILLAGSLWLVATDVARKPVGAVKSAREAQMGLLSLTRLAFDDPASFDAALNEASRDSLPNFQGSDSTLQVLSKE